jgi:glutamine amidotransferase
MCRLAAYTGPSLHLDELLLKPQHSLVTQSWAPREMVEARLNADGYGFGWFDDDGHPLRYRHTMPIWTDPNLPELGKGLKSKNWVAVVRSATANIPIHLANTMPYADERFHFMHNGYINKFSQTLRSCLRRELKPEYEDMIEGNTDSEHLFILFKQVMWETGTDDPASGLAELVERLKTWLGGERALLNIVIAQPGTIWAMRYAINGNCPSLYYSLNPPAFPGASLVASEPLTDDDDWTEFPPHTLLIFKGSEEPEHIHL